MLGSNLIIAGAKYKAPATIDYVDIMDGNTKIRLIDENSASGDVVLEDNKEVTITTNGSTVINPSSGKDAMKKVTATVRVPTADLEDNKTATIDASTYVSPIEITPTAGKDGMKKATITVSNIPEAVDVESNKAATIDASTYTQPVEITPTSGKDAMEKATVTITNIPSGQVNAYCWGDNDFKFYTDFSSAPSSVPSGDYYILMADDGLVEKRAWEDVGFDDYTYEKVDDSTIRLTLIDDPTDTLTLTRLSVNDFVLW